MSYANLRCEHNNHPEGCYQCKNNMTQPTDWQSKVRNAFNLRDAHGPVMGMAATEDFIQGLIKLIEQVAAEEYERGAKDFSKSESLTETMTEAILEAEKRERTRIVAILEQMRKTVFNQKDWSYRNSYFKALDEALSAINLPS